MLLKIKRVRNWTAKHTLPAYNSAGAAGLDLSADGNYVLPPGRIVAISTGLAVEIPVGFEGQVRGRSGLAFNHNIFAPHIGTIDSDYRGEIKILLENRGTVSFEIKSGDRVAQLVIAPVARVTISLVSELTETVRGGNGFGSTGGVASAANQIHACVNGVDFFVSKKQSSEWNEEARVLADMLSGAMEPNKLVAVDLERREEAEA